MAVVCPQNLNLTSRSERETVSRLILLSKEELIGNRIALRSFGTGKRVSLLERPGRIEFTIQLAVGGPGPKAEFSVSLEINYLSSLPSLRYPQFIVHRRHSRTLEKSNKHKTVYGILTEDMTKGW